MSYIVKYYPVSMYNVKHPIILIDPSNRGQTFMGGQYTCVFINYSGKYTKGATDLDAGYRTSMKLGRLLI